MRAAHITAWLAFLVMLALFVFTGYSQDHWSPMPWVLPEWLMYVGGVGAVVAAVVAVNTKRLTCDRCRAYAGRKVSREQIDARPTHARVDGSPDRRYKHNPWIKTFKITFRCESCQNEWTRREEG